jgi:hypothetical protein
MTCYQDGVAFAIYDKVYVGAAGDGYQFWEYNPSTDGWAQKSTHPGGPMDDPMTFSLGGAGYCAFQCDVCHNNISTGDRRFRQEENTFVSIRCFDEGAHRNTFPVTLA